MNNTKQLAAWMAKEIVKQAKQYQIKEPVYGLIVCYSTDSTAFPPWIAIGTERERERMTALDLEKEGLYAQLWSGEELELFEPIEAIENDIAFMDSYAEWVAAADVDGRLPERISALALRVCFALQKVDWGAVFPTTDDFTVMANDQKCQWLETNASALLDEKKRMSFIEKGWLMG